MHNDHVEKLETLPAIVGIMDSARANGVAS